MIDFTVNAEIDRPISDVFAYVTNPSKLSTWQTNTISAETLDTGPVGVGTRLREVHRAPGGKQHESVVEVSVYEVNRAFALRMLEGPLPLDAHIEFEQLDERTQIRLHAYGQPTGAMRLAQPLLRQMLRRQFVRYCDTLKQVLENDTD